LKTVWPDLGTSLFLIVFGVAFASVVSSLARVQAVGSSGLTLRTVLGLKHLAWNEIEAPVLFRPGPLLIHLIVRPKARPFFSLRTRFGVVARLQEAERLSTELSSFIAVKDGNTLTGMP
jgi:hypothetical protein